MTTITMRTLSRETARMLDQIHASQAPVVITRDGVPTARLVPMSPVEQALYKRLIDMGVDPTTPPPPNRDLKPLPPTPPGQKSAFDYLMDERDSYYADES